MTAGKAVGAAGGSKTMAEAGFKTYDVRIILDA